MVTSTQLTREINKHPNPEVAEFKFWRKARYLVAQEVATSDYKDTKIGYFEGRVVIPGPKYNPKCSDGLAMETATLNDFQIMKNRFFIRFVDNRTTQDADDSIAKALYTIMSDSDANKYEAELFKQMGIPNDNKPKRVSRTAA